MNPTSEKGIAMILALFMVLVLSVLSTSMMFVSQTETWSSQNYRMASQARYAAESGMHRAANFIMFAYTPPSTGGADSIVNYDMTKTPVEVGGQPVVLSSNPDVPANYPVAGVVNAFAAAAVGGVTLNNTPVGYTATATLLAMQEIIDAATGGRVTLQTWEIDAEGAITGARSAEVEVSVVIERQPWPVYAYAAFAEGRGCGAMNFTGGATTGSYDSSGVAPGTPPAFDPSYGNIGTNGNVDGSGATTVINGSLSTPRSGVGNCTANNVTASSLNGATVTDGLVQLSQPIDYPTPPAPNPIPPTSNYAFNGPGCPAALAFPACTPTATGAVLDAALAGGTMVIGNMNLSGGAEVHLTAGTYIVNALDFAGGSQIVIDSGPVIFQVAGKTAGGGDMATPIKIVGNTVSNDTYAPTNLQIFYAGTGNVALAGGAEASMLLYAPNATAALAGGFDYYGALVVNRLSATGGTRIHYDRNLQNSGYTASNFQMTSFSWKNY